MQKMLTNLKIINEYDIEESHQFCSYVSVRVSTCVTTLLSRSSHTMVATRRGEYRNHKCSLFFTIFNLVKRLCSSQKFVHYSTCARIFNLYMFTLVIPPLSLARCYHCTNGFEQCDNTRTNTYEQNS